MKHEAVLSFEYDSSNVARRVERSVRPELDDVDDDRSQASVERTGETLTLTVEASDLVALRAGLNTWLSLVSVAEATGGV